MNPKRKFLAGMISAGLFWNTSALALDIPPDILNEVQQAQVGAAVEKLVPPPTTAPSCDARTQLLDAVTNTGMCGIKPDGKVGCWGVPVDADTPTQPDDSFLQISGDGSDYGYAVGVREDGTVKGWNGTAYPIEGQFTQVQGIRGALGGGGYALRTNGVLSSWMRANLFRVTPPGTFTQVNGQCALKTDGKAVCWGENQYGQAIPPSDTFVYVVGGNTSCGIKTDGTLLCWGLNNQTSPATAGTFTPFPGTFSQVDVGSFNCAIRTDGTLACWGDYLRYVILPPATETFTQISAGYARFCGIKTDGTASCWGHSSVTPLLPSGLKLKTCGTIKPNSPTTLTVIPSTEGTVISTDIKCGINGTSCSAQLPANLPVGLEAKPAPGYKFAKWSGDCQGTTSFVRISLNTAKSCSASFTKVTPATSCSNNLDGLMACYRFSGNAEDSSGYGNHGEFINGTTLTEDRFGNAFSAYKLDGVDDYINVNDDPSIRMDNSFTVVAWLNTTASGNNIIEGISGNEPYPVASWILSGGSYYVPRLTISNTQTEQFIVSDSKVLPSREWTQLAGVWDQQAKTIALYRNGVKVKSDMQQVLTRYIHTKGLVIGKHGNDYAPGSIDDIRIFNRVLSDNEVKQLYDFDMNNEAAAKVTLTVTKTGNGQVTGNGITCGTDCTEDLAPNTQVTLTATATTGSMFKQWTGDCTGTTATVTVTMDKAKSCSATFELLPVTYTLNVTKTGNGNIKGTGIDCGTDCTEANLAANTQVTLTATPDAGNQFAGWAGACTGTEATTTVTMTADQTCEAKFMPAGIPLTVNKADTDRGRISGRLRGETATSLTCDNACQTANYNYPKDGVVILTATADKGFEFKTWTCTGSSYTQDPATSNILKVTMTTATTCTANFDAIGPLATLTVNLIGTGNGTVISNKVGLTCSGQSCTGTYVLGQKLTLTATPSVFATFLNWGSDCTGNNAKVSLTLTKDLTCTAQFQSILEAAATELVKVLYTNGFLENNADVASQFPQTTNQDRLKEAFWLAATAILQAESNLAATQQWPAQLNSIPWYSKSPIGQYTESIQLQAGEYVDIQLKLLDNAGVEQEVVIVIYYSDTPPTPVGDSGSGRYSIPIYVPKSFASQWGW